MQAFLDAYGWGAVATGGRGGRVIEVTNLNDSGPGSLRTAIKAAGARIIVFLVAGVIELLSLLEVRNGDCTIAGQTAPGSGIVLTGKRLTFKSSNHILRFISWRGDGVENNFITFRSISSAGCSNILVDHCSGAWAMRNLIGINHQTAGWPAMENITIQNCIIAEGDRSHPTGLAVTQTTGLSDINHVSVLNNFFVHMGHRNPLVRGKFIEVINNVAYNWANRCTDSNDSRDEGAPEADFINNDWQKGPMSSGRGPHLHDLGLLEVPASIYVAGNYAPDFGVTDPAADNWPLVRELNSNAQLSTIHQRLTPLAQSPNPLPVVAATSVWDNIKGDVGNSRGLNADGSWFARRDAIDQRLVEDRENGTGPSVVPTVPVENLPPIDLGTAYVDIDSDGMPDVWEVARGLDPNDPADGPIIGPNGYSNVELFLNGEPTNGGGIMSVVDDLNAVESALRSEAAALIAQADAVAAAVVELIAVDDVLDAAADVIVVD